MYSSKDKKRIVNEWFNYLQIQISSEFQKIENCLPEDHDIKAHMCITENTIYEFK